MIERFIMEKKTNWDAIPSLDGLKVDWEYTPDNPLGKRSFVRMNAEEIVGMFEVKEILVKIATANSTHTGRLLDISKGGIALSLPVSLAAEQPIKLGFFLGSKKIISRAIVKHVNKLEEDGSFLTGVQFVDLDQETAQYIAGLYASKILRHV